MRCSLVGNARKEMGSRDLLTDLRFVFILMKYTRSINFDCFGQSIATMSHHLQHHNPLP